MTYPIQSLSFSKCLPYDLFSDEEIFKNYNYFNLIQGTDIVCETYPAGSYPANGLENAAVYSEAFIITLEYFIALMLGVLFKLDYVIWTCSFTCVLYIFMYSHGTNIHMKL